MDSFLPNDNVVNLSTAPNPALAHIWANLLRGEGIHCQVVGDFLDAGIGDISGMQPQIWIKRQDMTHAQTVLGRCRHSVVDASAATDSRDPEREPPIPPAADRRTAQFETALSLSDDTLLPKQATAIAFDLDPASLSSLRKALPGWNIEVLAAASEASLTSQWHPGKVDLLVVQADNETRTLALCRFLVRCPLVSRDFQDHGAEILGPRGSLQTPAQRAHAPLLVLLSAGHEDLVNSVLEAGAHSCLLLPIEAKDVASMLVHARAGNRPGRHTQSLEGAQTEDRWRDDGGQG
jgi:CheY-like chemotaxis protein